VMLILGAIVRRSFIFVTIDFASQGKFTYRNHLEPAHFGTDWNVMVLFSE